MRMTLKYNVQVIALTEMLTCINLQAESLVKEKSYGFIGVQVGTSLLQNKEKYFLILYKRNFFVCGKIYV
ncbi:hypothetical protein CQA53_04550 [Helicobacter didelphidarum]|uniref:Uncharacterized protein n=1 Tax=Helicobacter didelphidarum TaxID=2040648 RepID=A0A3D8ILJ1_9HELI|nr:hypothetical protein [Helicobacter didelphidarum]RDU66078.1 hypothetical protein CQA53_04550 [Helicobacter didelphidarum]